MGPVARRGLSLLAFAIAMAVSLPSPTLAFSGFGALSADSTYGSQMRFTVELPGGPPDKLELLLTFEGSDATLVAPVTAGASSAQYVWNAADRPITPNTKIVYRWRASTGGVVTLSAEKTLLYDDDRPGLNWQSARIGDATVHWYGGAEAQARHFGTITANAAAAAEKMLGHALVGPVDIFVYDTHDDFFGALGPGAREWTGAATFPQLRTIFMWLQGGSSSYLETTMTHEVTHVVFRDATGNPYHEPAKWFNEGLAVWSEQQSAASESGTVQSAVSGGLLAFDGIAESFPIGDQAARLSYAEGATMVQMIIDKYGRKAIAEIAAAYGAGAGDAEALKAGTRITAQQLYADYFASFGADAPAAVKPAAILPSNVTRPPQPAAASGAELPSASPTPAEQPGQAASGFPWVALVVVAGVAVGATVGLLARRRRQPPGLP